MQVIKFQKCRLYQSDMPTERQSLQHRHRGTEAEVDIMKFSVLLCILVVQFGAGLSVSAVKFKSCNHVREAGFLKNQTYTLRKNDTTSFRETERQDSIVPGRTIREDLEIVWNYWAGLDNIHYLTATGYNILNVLMYDWSNVAKYIDYSQFNAPNYELSIRGSVGQVPDDLLFNHGMKFATYDKNDYNGCAIRLRVGWWYNDCTYALPTGVYYPGGNYTPTDGFYDGVFWKDWRGYGYSLKFIIMSLSTV
ncbi:angiopoietin-related protein 1-like [Saccostrea echinata]|uniref:angiopoietin-related protein 1-like n=1 Tax=Saccostrea echinata TaxID=191078 RepID=UPI002A80F6ED|nr:angiopoietin-related protein 1-like [Saccostrea echinata]